jgi:hypothetical protein
VSVTVELKWADIQAMPPGRIRDQLTYAYKVRNRRHMERAEQDAADIARILDDAETERLTAVATYGNGSAPC